MEVKVDVTRESKKEVSIKDKVVYDILIPSIKAGLFAFLYSLLMASMFGTPLSTDDICHRSSYDRSRVRDRDRDRRYHYSYYNRRDRHEF